MSKKNNKAQPESIPAQEPQSRPEPQQPARPPVSKAQIWTFWGAVAGALVAARALDAALPAVPERVIERWIMVAFAAFLGIFLFKLK
jgi:hypothetical protein